MVLLFVIIFFGSQSIIHRLYFCNLLNKLIVIYLKAFNVFVKSIDSIAQGFSFHLKRLDIINRFWLIQMSFKLLIKIWQLFLQHLFISQKHLDFMPLLVNIEPEVSKILVVLLLLNVEWSNFYLCLRKAVVEILHLLFEGIDLFHVSFWTLSHHWFTFGRL